MTLTADTDAPTTNGWAPAPAPLGETPRTLTEIDRLREERDTAQAGRTRIEADFESFKIRVAAVGEAAARRHGWCGTYDAILAELGLTRPVRRITGTITVTVNFEGTPQRRGTGVVSRLRPRQPPTSEPGGNRLVRQRLGRHGSHHRCGPDRGVRPGHDRHRLNPFHRIQ